MRSSRVITLTLVVALSVAGPNVFGKVCHPKKMITCNAADLSRPVAASTVSSPAPKSVTKVKATAPAKNDQAMACGPWVRWHCIASDTLG